MTFCIFSHSTDLIGCFRNYQTGLAHLTIETCCCKMHLKLHHVKVSCSLPGVRFAGHVKRSEAQRHAAATCSLEEDDPVASNLQREERCQMQLSSSQKPWLKHPPPPPRDFQRPPPKEATPYYCSLYNLAWLSKWTHAWPFQSLLGEAHKHICFTAWQHTPYLPSRLVAAKPMA